MRLLVLGATGMLGRDLMRLAGDETVGLGSADADVTDRAAVGAAVTEARPEVVLNCAGFTDVDGAESSAEQALRVNGKGAGNVAAAAERAGAAVLYVSSDYVFDGRKHEPYADFPRPAPRPAYSVLASERSNAIALPAWQEGLDAYPAERKVRA